MIEELDKEEQEILKPGQLDNVLLNPLADYKLQTKVNTKRILKNISNTDMKNQPIMTLLGGTEKERFISYEEFDNTTNSKLIINATNRDVVLSLKPSAHKLFLWILYSLQYRTDVITIKLDLLGERISPAGFREGLEQLEANNIIKRIGTKQKDKDYWDFHYNPQYMFRGSAKDFYKDVLKDHPEYLDKQKMETPTIKKRATKKKD